MELATQLLFSGKDSLILMENTLQGGVILEIWIHNIQQGSKMELTPLFMEYQIR